MLVGTRSVPALGSGNDSSKTTTLKIPFTKADITAAYNLLACANDMDKTGKNGPVNCKVSSSPQPAAACNTCH